MTDVILGGMTTVTERHIVNLVKKHKWKISTMVPREPVLYHGLVECPGMEPFRLLNSKCEVTVPKHLEPVVGMTSVLISQERIRKELGNGNFENVEKDHSGAITMQCGDEQHIVWSLKTCKMHKRYETSYISEKDLAQNLKRKLIQVPPETSFSYLVECGRRLLWVSDRTAYRYRELGSMEYDRRND